VRGTPLACVEFSTALKSYPSFYSILVENADFECPDVTPVKQVRKRSRTYSEMASFPAFNKAFAPPQERLRSVGLIGVVIPVFRAERVLGASIHRESPETVLSLCLCAQRLSALSLSDMAGQVTLPSHAHTGN